MERALRILSILNEIRPDSNFEDSQDFIEEFQLESFDIVTLIPRLEEEYDIEIAQSDILPNYFCSVAALEQLIDKSSSV